MSTSQNLERQYTLRRMEGARNGLNNAIRRYEQELCHLDATPQDICRAQRLEQRIENAQRDIESLERNIRNYRSC